MAFTLCMLFQGCNGKHDPKAATTDAAPVLSIPIERGKLWVAEVQSANRSYHFMVDTDTTWQVLDTSDRLPAAPLTQEAEAALIRQGALRSATDGGTVAVSTPDTTAQFKLALSPAVRVQGWTIPAGTLTIRMSMAGLSSATHTQLDGIIGMESLRNLTWVADYAAGRLTAYANEAPAHEWQQCTFMTLSAKRTPTLWLELDGKPTEFELDTGADQDVDLPRTTFDALAKANRFNGIGTNFSSTATGRFIPGRVALLGGLAIGATPLPKLLVSDGRETPSIGLGLLEKMDRVELDFRHYRFCFDLPAVPRDSQLSTTDAILQPSGNGYRIAALAPHGWLAASGIKIGDLIVAIDRTPVTTLEPARVYALLGTGAREVTVQHGNRTRVFKLKRI